MITLQELRSIETRAKLDDSDALYQSGMMHWTGRWIEGVVIPQDKTMALRLIQRAADRGHEAAASFLATHHDTLRIDERLRTMSETSDIEKETDIAPPTSEASLSAEMTPTQGANETSPSKDNPFLLLGFWEFAIISTLVIVFFPWSLLLSLLLFGMEQTKFLVIALLHDFLKTLGAVITVLLAALAGAACIYLVATS